jgi:hypothetical protein
VFLQRVDPFELIDVDGFGRAAKRKVRRSAAKVPS